MIELTDLLPLTVLGAVLGLDVVSFPQMMSSRPLIAATLGGAFVGAPLAGLATGAVLELIALETLPIGASRYPEWGSAAVVGGALFGSQTSDRPGAMVLAVVAALATAWIGGWTMVMLRRLNALWARRHRASLDAGSYRTVVGLQIFGLTADLLRAAMLTWTALLLLGPAVAGLLRLWALDPRSSRAVVVGAAAAIAIGAVWKLFHLTPGARWLFVGGLAAGLLLLVVR